MTRTKRSSPALITTPPPSDQHRIAWTLRKAEAESIAYIAEREGVPVALVDAIRRNCLDYPEMVARMKSPPFDLDGLTLARVMADPNGFADALFADMENPDGWDGPLNYR